MSISVEGGIFVATRFEMGIDRDEGSGEPQAIPAGSHAEFITEHYWGYTRLRAGCSEYRVEHPRWKIWNADMLRTRADIRDPLRRTIRRNADRAAAIRIYCGWFANYRRAKVNFPVAALCERRKFPPRALLQNYLRTNSCRNTNGRMPPCL